MPIVRYKYQKEITAIPISFKHKIMRIVIVLAASSVQESEEQLLGCSASLEIIALASYSKSHSLIPTHSSNLHIVTCRGLRVTSETGFGLDDWIYFKLYSYIHNSGLQAIQRYHWFTHITFHRYSRARILSLH
jgi:hypothetical protein